MFDNEVAQCDYNLSNGLVCSYHQKRLRNPPATTDNWSQLIVEPLGERSKSIKKAHKFVSSQLQTAIQGPPINKRMTGRKNGPQNGKQWFMMTALVAQRRLLQTVNQWSLLIRKKQIDSKQENYSFRVYVPTYLLLLLPGIPSQWLSNNRPRSSCARRLQLTSSTTIVRRSLSSVSLASMGRPLTAPPSKWVINDFIDRSIDWCVWEWVGNELVGLARRM